LLQKINPCHISNFFKDLHLQELKNKRNLHLNRGNIFRDYHFRDVGGGDIDLAKLGITDGMITHLVIVEDIICIICLHLQELNKKGNVQLNMGWEIF
jgi:hypothetical protein